MAQQHISVDQRLLEISDTLIGARRAAIALPGFPGNLPASFAEAYEVQHISRETWADQVVGWKVGGVPLPFVERFGERRLTGPIFASSVVHAEKRKSASMPIFEGGFGAIEPEFIVQLGESRLEDRMFIGAEIASSPIPAINDVGPIAVICDFGNNNGMLLGPEIEHWQSLKPENTTVRTIIDGQEIASSDLNDIRTGAQRSLEFLIAHAHDHGIDLPAGTFISTGAITGVHEAKIGAASRLEFGRFGTLELVLTKAEAQV